MTQKFQTGALLDYRTDEEKAKDWTVEELGLVAGAPASVWVEKKIEDVKRYSPRNQGMSLSCVANGIAIALEANEKLESGVTRVFSHRDIYARRVNKPYGGMMLEDALKIMREGAAFEGQVPSMGLSETPINAAYDVTTQIKQTRATYAAGASAVIKAPHIDTVTQLLDQKFTLTAFWFFDGNYDYQEWWNRRATIINPNLGLYDANALHHQAHLVDYGLWNGERVIFAQDSAGVGTGNGEFGDIRIIPLDFFLKRMYALGHGIDKKNLDYTVSEKPKGKLTRSLKEGMDGEDVRFLQKVLVYEGCMELKNPTIHFRGATLKGVKNLQAKYKDQILKPAGLKLPTGFVGENTIRFINQKYA